MKIKEERDGVTISTTVDPESIAAVVVLSSKEHTEDTIILRGGEKVMLVPPSKTDQDEFERMILFERKGFSKITLAVGDDVNVSILSGPYSVGAVQTYNSDDKLSIKILFTGGGTYSIPMKFNESDREKTEETAEKIKSIIEDKHMKRFI